MRIAIAIEYDGAGFCGWQSQPEGCGVQDHLQNAIAQIAGHAITLHAAGRTDAGVHALTQIAHFDVSAQRPASAWVRGVNALLPAAARVLWAHEVSGEFHARFSARSRCYQYLLINRSVAPALLADKAGWHHAPLDAEAMRVAAKMLLGEHDFSAFRAAQCQAKSPVKTLREAEVTRHGDAILFEFRANAFLHHQVRNMVGALVYIGKGEHPPEWIATLLAQRDRTQAPPTFSASGLYLAGVDYDAAFGLPLCERRLADLPMPHATS
ncbi:MAG: tRNA pseudouridine(38-40) synthase TruA [Methylobacillus sp.]|nr:tRNA pseudouridine(38-40) synthase TruA [Methylobacillus sp.]